VPEIYSFYIQIMKNKPIMTSFYIA